jgi:hypothetical protein
MEAAFQPHLMNIIITGLHMEASLRMTLSSMIRQVPHFPYFRSPMERCMM